MARHAIRFVWLALTVCLTCAPLQAKVAIEFSNATQDWLKVGWPSTRPDRADKLTSGPIRAGACIIASLSGTISFGDGKRVTKILHDALESAGFGQIRHDDNKHKCFDVSRSERDSSVPHNILILNTSDGGSFLDAVEIAKFIGRNNFTTVVPAGMKCLSACAVIFINGSYRRNSWDLSPIPSRWMHITAEVGFHTPFPKYGGDQSFTPDQANRIYGVGAQHIVQYFEFVRRGLTDEAIQQELLEVSSPTQYMKILNVSDAVRWNIDLFGYKISVVDEDVGAFFACANIWNYHLRKEPMEYNEPEVLEYRQVDKSKILPLQKTVKFVDEGHAFYLSVGTVPGGTRRQAKIVVGGARFNWEIDCEVRSDAAFDKKHLRRVIMRRSTVSALITPLPASFYVPVWYLRSRATPLNSL